MTAPHRRVCIVTGRYGPQVNGGAEVLLRQLAHRLSGPCQVTVATTRAEDYLSWQDQYPPGESWDGPVRVLRFSVDFPRDVEQFLAVNTALGQTAPTLAQQARWVWEQGPVCLDLLKWLAAHRQCFDVFLFGPYLYFPTVFGLPLVAEKSILLPMAHNEGPIHLPLYRQLFQAARALCYLTADEKALVRQLFAEVSHLDMIGGAGVEVPAQTRPDSFREKYGIEGPYAVYVGRIEVGKCCDEMFRQWEAYKAAGGPGTLVLMGKAIMPVPRRADVRALGFVSEQDKYNGIAGADFLWLPSRYESLSIAVLEAMCLGVPVLVNGGCSVLKSHCRKSRAGLWYETDGGCRAMLRRLFADAPLRAALGAGGPGYVRDFYRWDTIIQRLCGLVDLVAQAAAGNTGIQAPGAQSRWEGVTAIVTPWFSAEAYGMARKGRDACPAVSCADAAAAAALEADAWPDALLREMEQVAAAVQAALAAGQRVEILTTTSLPAQAPWRVVPDTASTLLHTAPQQYLSSLDLPGTGAQAEGPAEKGASAHGAPSGAHHPPACTDLPMDGSAPEPPWVWDAFAEDVAALEPGVTLRRFSPANRVGGTRLACTRLTDFVRSRPGLQLVCLPDHSALAHYARAAARQAQAQFPAPQEPLA